MPKFMSGAEIRRSFVQFFEGQGHSFVPSASLVPANDPTLLFTNAGMVQFKDVFLGLDTRPYVRAVDYQRCMRVSGKHNDLDQVGRDDTHHTLFEMLGNWSFGDYYKEEAIAWAWELLTDVWGIDKDRLWATCFRDEKGQIPADDEALEYWRQQPGMDPSHILTFGRKENFWEMADTGPCGPCSEIHIDRGEAFCNKKDVPGHVCRVNGDCERFLELWNLVFIQYNRLDADKLEPLPKRHVDTGMGLERVAAVLQGVGSNYRTDLFWPLILRIQELSGQSDEEREANFTPYRVIADHARAATFLIADGVRPGNLGRNYVCRMIIRRAARFGMKLGLHLPFMAGVAEVVIQAYGDVYPELKRDPQGILRAITEEEERFARTLDAGTNQLDELVSALRSRGETVLDGRQAFELYATHGLPLEIVRDMLSEQGLEVDESGFYAAMEEHRLASAGGKLFGPMGGRDVDVYQSLFQALRDEGKLGAEGVDYDPYDSMRLETEVAAIVGDGQPVDQAGEGEAVEIVLPRTCFYVEGGGQVSDTGTLFAEDGSWEISVEDMRRPAAGMITHVGHVLRGTVHVGDRTLAVVDAERRHDIMRNHTATHLLHAALHAIVGEHALQAGSLVAPDRLRFDFSQPEPLSAEQLRRVEALVNRMILENHQVIVRQKPLQEAIASGAMALFSEKYGDVVRTITIGDEPEPVSYELCGGTHVAQTADIGLFLIVSESSAAAGIRRIEAVTGRGAYELVQRRFGALNQTGELLSTGPEQVPERVEELMAQLETSLREAAQLRRRLVRAEFEEALHDVQQAGDVTVLGAVLEHADAEALREMSDLFRERYPQGVVLLGSANGGGRPVLVAAVSDGLTARGLHAGELVKQAAQLVGGSGGGRPTFAQAGGKDAARLQEAVREVYPYVRAKVGGG